MNLLLLVMCFVCPAQNILQDFGHWQQSMEAHVISDPVFPTRTENNLIVASYNIKWLGHTKHDPGKLAKVIQNFDICGIIEIKKVSALIEIVQKLEAQTEFKWGYTYGLRTHRPQGKYYEAYGVIWRKDRAEIQGLVSGVWDVEETFRNDPYIVSFKSGQFDFALMLIHTRWTDDIEGSREDEVLSLATHLNWMRDFLNEGICCLI